jgi:hypothetical protein
MTQRKPITLLSNTTAASATGSAPADFRFESGGHQRTLFGFLATGQEINVYIYPDAAKTIEHLETTISAGSSSFTTATRSFLEVLNGPFHSIEVRTVVSASAATPATSKVVVIL